jgi:hypothetical protein
VKVLLDECIDRYFARGLLGFEVTTVPRMGWASKKNGELLSLAEKMFDALVTVDLSMHSQQNVTKYAIAVIVLQSRSNKYEDLAPFAPQLIEILPHAAKGVVTWRSPPGAK